MAREIIVSDGETLWKYTPHQKRVERTDLARIRGEYPELWQRAYPNEARLLWDKGLGSIYLPSIVFLGTEALDGVTAYVFEGLPARELTAGITKVRAWIGEDGIWRRIECYAGEELYTVAELEVLELDGEVPDGEFTLELPRDVWVYDITEQTLLELR
jgi:outer membrane lipoprotein-sorting protein